MSPKRPSGPRLFASPGDDPPARGPAAYRVTAPGGRVIARTTNLPFAVAQARALALRGYAAWLRDDDGNCVEVARTPDGLTATSTTNPPWLATCQALLAEHG